MTALALDEIRGAYDIAADDIVAFQRDGHVKLEGVLDAETIAAYRPHIVRAVYEGREPNTGANLNLWTRDEIVRRFVLNPRLGRVAADLLGVDAVRVFRDEPYFKVPGGVPTPWHQDAFFLPLDTKKIATLWIPLMDIAPEHAPMSYMTGSHRAGPLGFSMPSAEGMASFEARMRDKGFEVATHARFSAGDVAAHDGWTLHSAPTNTSHERREVLIILYFADGARVKSAPVAPGVPGLDELLPGAQPGDVAASELTPLVFDRRQTR
ncbi:MAG TPA: phytanoyl-CoA dioxygenase family protein [Thermoanaerobaculia bacterium]